MLKNKWPIVESHSFAQAGNFLVNIDKNGNHAEFNYSGFMDIER